MESFTIVLTLKIGIIQSISFNMLNTYLDFDTFLCQRPAPKNECEMMVAIFEYIDRIFGIIRPTRLLYLAIDGVVVTYGNS